MREDYSKTRFNFFSFKFLNPVYGYLFNISTASTLADQLVRRLRKFGALSRNLKYFLLI